MIKLAKLVSHEFVIGRYIDNVITNAALVMFNTDATTGQPGIKIVPYMHPITASVAKIITAEKIIYMEDAPQQLQISYLEMIKQIIAKNQTQENTNEQNGVSGADSGETGKTKGETAISE